MDTLKQYPLPADWEMKYDFSTKRFFFINHKTKTTSWDDPRLKLYGKEIAESKGISRADFIDDENDNDLSKVLKLTEKEYEVEKAVNNLSKKFPKFQKTYIRQVYEKAKGNISNVEVLLRQESRKETTSQAAQKGIVDTVRNSDNIPARFSLSHRKRYDAPGTSVDRIKFQIRYEFPEVDNRIIDRVLEVANNSIDEARNILKSKMQHNCMNHQTEEEFEDFLQQRIWKNDKLNEEKKNVSSDFKMSNLKSSKSDSNTHTKQSKSSTKKSNESRAIGPDPNNFKGSKYKNNKII